jgi:hypothetical protein
MGRKVGGVGVRLRGCEDPFVSVMDCGEEILFGFGA